MQLELGHDYKWLAGVISLLDVLNKIFILTVPNIQVDSFQAPQQPRNPKIEQVWNEIMIFQVNAYSAN